MSNTITIAGMHVFELICEDYQAAGQDLPDNVDWVVAHAR